MNYFFPIQVRFADTDAQGHVFFGNYFTFFDEAISGLLRARGWSYDAMRARGFELVYAHAECDYQQPALFEQVLNVDARVAQLGNSSVTFECAAKRATNGAEIARGKLIMVMRDCKTGRKTNVPDAFRKAVAEWEK